MDRFAQLAKLAGALLPWYEENHRDLPWRNDKDPYHIWVSEIMLQQTRVEAVKGYYARFLKELPDISALAACEDEKLHKLWEGLGYYSRVRNLKKAAQQVMEEHGGIFPSTHEKILSLPGIGEYTAGAIASIAFNQPTPSVDGNVLRVIARITDDPTPIETPAFKRLVQQRLAEVYPAEAGDFTQALMELGATVCGPNRLPDCENCPCKDFCLGFRNHSAASLPVRTPKRQRREEEYTVFVLSCDGRFAVEKRPDQGLLAGLWQFPNVPGKLDLQAALTQVEQIGAKPKEIKMQVERKHIFTHIEWNMSGVYIEVEEPMGAFTWVSVEELHNQTALPTAFRQFVQEAEGTE